MYQLKINPYSGANRNNSAPKAANTISFKGYSKCVLPDFMGFVEGQMRNVRFRVALGDMTKIKADAYIVPNFKGGASYGGVGGSVARAGAVKGLEEFDNFVAKNGIQEFGSVLLTDSHGGNSDKLLHAVSVGSGASAEFGTVQSSIYNALQTAEKNGVKSVVSPAMGTGIIGDLTPEQSAKAIFSALKKFADEGKNIDFSVVIYGDTRAYNDFLKTMTTKSYESLEKEVGQKDFNVAKWFIEMQRDIDANKESGIK